MGIFGGKKNEKPQNPSSNDIQTLEELQARKQAITAALQDVNRQEELLKGTKRQSGNNDNSGTATREAVKILQERAKGVPAASGPPVPQPGHPQAQQGAIDPRVYQQQQAELARLRAERQAMEQQRVAATGGYAIPAEKLVTDTQIGTVLITIFEQGQNTLTRIQGETLLALIGQYAPWYVKRMAYEQEQMMLARGELRREPTGDEDETGDGATSTGDTRAISDEYGGGETVNPEELLS